MSRPPSSRSWLIGALLAASALALATQALGCAPPGDEPRNTLSLYLPESGAYRVYYLDPPWELVGVSDVEAYFRIRSNAMIAGGLDGGPGKFELRTTIVAGEPNSLAREELAALTRTGASAIDGPRAFVTEEGVSGVEVVARTASPVERWFRVALLPVDGGRSLRLAFEATPTLETEEVTRMIGFVGIGPEGAM